MNYYNEIDPFAFALGDKISKGKRMWISRSVDPQAARTAAALAGDRRAIVLDLNSFRVGLVAGIATSFLWLWGMSMNQRYDVFSSEHSVLELNNE